MIYIECSSYLFLLLQLNYPSVACDNNTSKTTISNTSLVKFLLRWRRLFSQLMTASSKYFDYFITDYGFWNGLVFISDFAKLTSNVISKLYNEVTLYFAGALTVLLGCLWLMCPFTFQFTFIDSLLVSRFRRILNVILIFQQRHINLSFSTLIL